MLRDLILRNRSYRRFDEQWPIDRQALRELVDLARLSASAANLQPLRYILTCDPQVNGEVFKHLAWAGYLKDWEGPAPGQRPGAYVIILGDTAVTRDFNCDHGIAAQSILLGAVEHGLGGCIVGSIDRGGMRAALGIAERYEILLVLALGKPAEQVEIETIDPGGEIKYWRDADGVHHVPKRPLDEVIVG